MDIERTLTRNQTRREGYFNALLADSERFREQDDRTMSEEYPWDDGEEGEGARGGVASGNGNGGGAGAGGGNSSDKRKRAFIEESSEAHEAKEKPPLKRGGTTPQKVQAKVGDSLASLTPHSSPTPPRAPSPLTKSSPRATTPTPSPSSPAPSTPSKSKRTLCLSNLYWVSKLGLPCIFYGNPGEELDDQINLLPISVTTNHYDVRVRYTELCELTRDNLKRALDEKTRDFAQALLTFYEWERERMREHYLTRARCPEELVNSIMQKPYIWPDLILDLIVHREQWRPWSKDVERRLSLMSKQKGKNMRCIAYFERLKEQYQELSEGQLGMECVGSENEENDDEEGKAKKEEGDEPSTAEEEDDPQDELKGSGSKASNLIDLTMLQETESVLSSPSPDPPSPLPSLPSPLPPPRSPVPFPSSLSSSPPYSSSASTVPSHSPPQVPAPVSPNPAPVVLVDETSQTVREKSHKFDNDTIAHPPTGNCQSFLDLFPSKLYWLPKIRLPAIFYDDPNAPILDSVSVYPISFVTPRYYLQMRVTDLQPLNLHNLSRCLDEKTREFAQSLILFYDWRRSSAVTTSPFVWPDFILNIVSQARWREFNRRAEKRLVRVGTGRLSKKLGGAAATRIQNYFETLRETFQELEAAAAAVAPCSPPYQAGIASPSPQSPRSLVFERQSEVQAESLASHLMEESSDTPTDGKRSDVGS
jgi:hypothetical protein